MPRPKGLASFVEAEDDDVVEIEASDVFDSADFDEIKFELPPIPQKTRQNNRRGLILDVNSSQKSNHMKNASIQIAKSGTIETHGFTIASYGITGTPAHPLQVSNKISSAFLKTISVDETNIDKLDDLEEQRKKEDENPVVLGSRVCIEDLVFLDNLGTGQNGTVRKALFLPTQSLVAVKMAGAYDKSSRHQILHELSVFEKLQEDESKTDLDESHVVRFIGGFMSEQRITVALEYFNMGSLEQFVIKQKGELTEGAIRHVCKQALLGLDYLHSRRQVHRDVKPANFLISDTGVLKISDFGLTKRLTRTRERCDTFVGTMSYLAPERVTGNSEYSYPVDIWALGISIFAMTKQKLPVLTEIWSMIDFMRKPVPVLKTEDGKFSEELADFVAQCLIKEQTDRPTAADLLKHPFITKQVARDEAWPYKPVRNVSVVEREAIGDAILDSLVKQCRIEHADGNRKSGNIQEIRQMPEQWRFLKMAYKKAGVSIAKQMACDRKDLLDVFEDRLRYKVKTTPQKWKPRQTMSHKALMILLNGGDMNLAGPDLKSAETPAYSNLVWTQEVTRSSPDLPDNTTRPKASRLLSSRRTEISASNQPSPPTSMPTSPNHKIERPSSSRRKAANVKFYQNVTTELTRTMSEESDNLNLLRPNRSGYNHNPSLSFVDIGSPLASPNPNVRQLPFTRNRPASRDLSSDDDEVHVTFDNLGRGMSSPSRLERTIKRVPSLDVNLVMSASPLKFKAAQTPKNIKRRDRPQSGKAKRIPGSSMSGSERAFTAASIEDLKPNAQLPPSPQLNMVSRVLSTESSISRGVSWDRDDSMSLSRGISEIDDSSPSPDNPMSVRFG